MRTLENTPDRLRLFFGSPGWRASFCTLDRGKDFAVVTNMFLFFPVRRVRLPLSTVIDANVQRIGRTAHRHYYPVLELRFGRSLRIARRTKTEAQEIASTIRGFLKIN